VAEESEHEGGGHNFSISDLKGLGICFYLLTLTACFTDFVNYAFYMQQNKIIIARFGLSNADISSIVGGHFLA